MTSDAETTADPVQVALVQARLDHICKQMGWVMTRTARSPIFSQSHDFSCFATNRDGVLVSTADGIPIHTGGGGFAVRAILDSFGDQLAEGDVYLLNDPYTAGGNHLPDWVIARPVFSANTLVGFCCNRAHQSDIGGGAAGTYNPEASEIFHEGLRLPVMQLIKAGELREDLWQLLLLNTRTPDLLDGDLRAMLGSTSIGAARLVDLVADLSTGQTASSAPGTGPERALRLFDAVCAHADRRFRALVTSLPDGTWTATEHWDDDCFGPADLHLRLRVTVAGDALTVDFTGTDDQIDGFKNSGWVNTWSAVSMALASFFEPDLPRNEGTFRCVTMIAPEGCIVNATPPAPMTMNTVIPAHEIIHLVWRCLSEADPGRALAGWGKNIFGVTAGAGPGEPYVMYHWGAAAGGGATDGRDGFNQIGHLVALGGLTLPDVEFTEHRYPVLHHRQEFRTDGGGAGRFRGGTGIEYEIDVMTEARWSFRGEGVGEPTGFGIQGGQIGVGGEIRLRSLVSEEEGGFEGDFVAPKYGLRRFGPVRMTALSPGGGGFGDPKERDRALVARDVLDGVVSAEAAQKLYGWTADQDAQADQPPS
jgi:N-methylhydantoinase B